MYCQEKMSICLSVSIFHGYFIVILCVYLSYFDFSWSDRTLSACWPCMAGACVSEAPPCAPVPFNQASCREGPITRTAQTTSKSNSCSTAHSIPWSCPGAALWNLIMEALGVQKLYKPSPTPILYVGLAADVLGRVPLTPLFLLGNSTPTIPHQLRQHWSARFPHGLADAADESGRKWSNVYEINQWLWQFGRGKLVCGACQWLRLSSGASQRQRIVQRGQGPKAPQGSHGPKAAGAPGGLE